MRIPAALCLLTTLMLSQHAHALQKPDWSYDNDYTGQEDWAAISDDYYLCESGAHQSPIHIGETSAADMEPLVPDTVSFNATVRMTDYTLEVKPLEKRTIHYEKSNYQLRAIRFHLPSEHLVRNVFYPAEIRLMYKSDLGQKLHVAVFVSTGSENKAIAAMLGHYARKKNSTRENFQFDLGDVFPQSRGYFAYEGSLTQPPCTEGVDWLVLKEPVEISDGQLQQLQAIIGRNTRLPQPTYFRTIRETLH